ncbi:MAG: hypothetical protein AAF533_13155, partial [Acidobacteriota bacterium]
LGDAFLPIMEKGELGIDMVGEGGSGVRGVDLGEAHGQFVRGTASGAGFNCLIHAIAQALGIDCDVELRQQIRRRLMELGLAGEGTFIYNDQNTLAAILQGLNANHNDVNIIFVQGNTVDDQTYNMNGSQTIYIYNVSNVHFEPMYPQQPAPDEAEQ